MPIISRVLGFIRKKRVRESHVLSGRQARYFARFQFLTFWRRVFHANE